MCQGLTGSCPCRSFFEGVFVDGIVKSRKIGISVIPAKAGIQSFQYVLDSGVRRSDKVQEHFNYFKILDSATGCAWPLEKRHYVPGFCWNERKRCFSTLYEIIFIAENGERRPLHEKGGNWNRSRWP
ncbi:MAG: hypothetical protein SWQ30_02130 [Thermodesulfobacteriota bacterium]|nr:hypothetical protein [Thermodesulfobacteriota bacterium]